MLLLPAFTQSTYTARYGSRLPKTDYPLTPLNEPLEVQERRLLSCSLRPDPYHKPKSA